MSRSEPPKLKGKRCITNAVAVRPHVFFEFLARLKSREKGCISEGVRQLIGGGWCVGARVR